MGASGTLQYSSWVMNFRDYDLGRRSVRNLDKKSYKEESSGSDEEDAEDNGEENRN